MGTLISICMSVYCQQKTMTQRESEADSDNIVSHVPSWSAGLARVGGFYQDGDWYNVNIFRRMPLVPKMVSELIYSLPPLGDARVLDLLSGSGALSIEVKKSYPNCKLSVKEKCPYRINQCQT